MANETTIEHKFVENLSSWTWEVSPLELAFKIQHNMSRTWYMSTEQLGRLA